MVVICERWLKALTASLLTSLISAPASTRWGPPEELRMIISRSVENLINYPDPCSQGLLSRLSEVYGIEKDQLLFANGSTEIIYALPRALKVKRAVIPVPSYLDYHRAAELAGLGIISPSLSEETGFRVDFSELENLLQDGDILFLGRPNNPTGVSFGQSEFLDMVTRFPEVFFAVDESFYEFIDSASGLITKEIPANLIVFRSLTKFYAIPGLRLGFAAGHPCGN